MRATSITVVLSFAALAVNRSRSRSLTFPIRFGSPPSLNRKGQGGSTQFELHYYFLTVYPIISKINRLADSSGLTSALRTCKYEYYLYILASHVSSCPFWRAAVEWLDYPLIYLRLIVCTTANRLCPLRYSKSEWFLIRVYAECLFAAHPS